MRRVAARRTGTNGMLRQSGNADLRLAITEQIRVALHGLRLGRGHRQSDACGHRRKDALRLVGLQRARRARWTLTE
jgi:hypothetical protein